MLPTSFGVAMGSRPTLRCDSRAASAPGRTSPVARSADPSPAPPPHDRARLRGAPRARPRRRSSGRIALDSNPPGLPSPALGPAVVGKAKGGKTDDEQCLAGRFGDSRREIVEDVGCGDDARAFRQGEVQGRGVAEVGDAVETTSADLNFREHGHRLAIHNIEA
jgi:hypothetical protein